MRKKINITLATNINGKGGISSVLKNLQDSDFFYKTNTLLVSTHKNFNGGVLYLVVYFIRSIFRLFYLNILYDCEIIHIHMSSRGSYSRKSLILKFAKLFGAKTIIHLHGSEFQQFYSDESSLKKQEKIRATFDIADKIIVLSSQWQQWMNSIVSDPSKVCVVYNAVPEVVLPKKTESKDVILFLGRLGKRKGVDDLINAFARVSLHNANAELHLGGDGDIAFYQKLIADLKLENKVKLLGWVSGDEKNQHTANATIYCLPSYNEGFPMGILEAMSNKVAVVSSKAGGIPDAITDKKEGVLINAGDVDALAVALSSLLSNPYLRGEYARVAYKKYTDNFTPKVINAQLESIYHELLADSL